MPETRQPDTDAMKWIRRGSALAVLLIGWAFILFANNFHITTPVVFVALGYFAAVAAIYTLYRTGSHAVLSNDEIDDEASWNLSLGALGELEREKRTLLKAIKEAEFDLQMGKLSKADADAMIAIYRARAIEVIKEIDIANSTSGKAGTVRERILREARARIAVESKAADAAPAADDKKRKGANKQKDRADKLAAAVAATKGDDAKAGAMSTGDAAAATDKADIAASSTDKATDIAASSTDKATDKATDIAASSTDKAGDKPTNIAADPPTDIADKPDAASEARHEKEAAR